MWCVTMIQLLAAVIFIGAVKSFDQTDLSYKTNSMQRTGRIAGGEEVFIKQYPYQISLEIKKRNNKMGLCGGFIIDATHIVTAAHCFRKVDLATLVVRVGSSYRTNGTTVAIVGVMPHPKFSQPGEDTDIVILTVGEPIQFDDYKKAIKIPPKDHKIDYNGTVVITGYGVTTYGDSVVPERLRMVEVPVLEPRYCAEVYPSITEQQWCAGYFYFGGKGACLGDAGGAAVQDGMAVGLVSYGRLCGYPYSPTVMVNIASPSIRDFINKHTGL